LSETLSEIDRALIDVQKNFARNTFCIDHINWRAVFISSRIGNTRPERANYLLTGEVFPTEVRGMGAGFAAATAKVGAVATRLPVPHPAGRHRLAVVALWAGGHLDPRSNRHLDVPGRNDRREPRHRGR
jgi:hypothetical protein